MEKPNYRPTMNERKTEADVSSDLTATTEHYENFVGKYPLPFSGNVAQILFTYAREPPFVQYENGGVRDLDHVIVKCAGARKWRPIAPRRHHYVRLTQVRAKRLVDGVPKPIFHPVSGVGIPG